MKEINGEGFQIGAGGFVGTAMDEPAILKLVRELVNRLVLHGGRNQSPSDSDRSFRYALRLLSSNMSPSAATDASALAESMKRRLVTDGKSSEALAFADLYTKFSATNGPGSVHNKGAVLYLLKVVSEDRRNSLDRSSAAGVPSSFLYPSVSLPAIVGRNREPLNGGVISVSKDPDNTREAVFRDFTSLLKEEADVSEEILVKEVLYACQGIGGRYIKLDKHSGAYALHESVRVPRATRTMVKRLCSPGELFLKIQSYILLDECTVVGQALRAALQDELSPYYKLLAVLEAQAANPVPLVSESETSENYLSLRRLSVWLAEPTVKMRLMADLIDKCGGLRGGAMAGAIHDHAKHGDPVVQDFMRRLLKRVCSPLFEMVRKWVLEGELDDAYAEFFILGISVEEESLWREGYLLHEPMLPSFISQSLALRILRTGKSINFLRFCCGDLSWNGTDEKEGLGYGETGALECLVSDASETIDRRLIDVLCGEYAFMDHCLAIKRYLLLGQGDFVQYLMDSVGPELSEPASNISSFRLSGILETSIRSSNAQYDGRDMLDRLKIKMMPHEIGDRGWDVFSLDYVTGVPLDTVFTHSSMKQYLKIFNFLWKLRRVEHALTESWKTMKPNVTSPFFRILKHAIRSQLLLTSRQCQVLWDEMNHFISNLQYYIMFEVLEVSWSNFAGEVASAKTLDDLLVAHDGYLNSIVEKSLLGEKSRKLRESLSSLFDLVLRFRSHADRLYEGIHELHARASIGDGRKALTQQATGFFQSVRRDLNSIANEYASLLRNFMSQLPLQQHTDLKFLMFRLDFTEFYSKKR